MGGEGETAGGEEGIKGRVGRKAGRVTREEKRKRGESDIRGREGS